MADYSSPQWVKDYIELLGQATKSVDAFIASQKTLGDAINKNVKIKEADAEATKKETKAKTDLQKIETQRESAVKRLTALDSKQAKELAKVRLQIQEKNKATKEELKLEKDLATVNSKSAGTLEKLAAKNRILTAERKKLNFETKEGRTRLKEINSELDKNNKLITKNSDGFGKMKRGIGGYAQSIKSSLIQMAAFAVGIQGMIRLVKSSVSIIANFEKANSKLSAVLGTTKSDIAELTKQQKDLGSTTRYTASEIAGLQTELAKLGFTQNEILLTTKSVQDLATATGADLSAAAKVTGATLRGFGLDASQAARVASVLAVATTKSALSFDDYEAALSNVAPVAASFGFSIEDTIALYGQLRNSGFDASKATTALRNILLNLADSNGALAQKIGGSVSSLDDLIPAMQKLDSEGISLNETLQLTDKRSVAAFNQLLNGSDSAIELRDSITDVNRELNTMVRTMEDNLIGDVTRLSSAWEGFVLNAEGSTNVFRSFVTGATQIVTALGNLDIVLGRASKFDLSQQARAFDIFSAFNADGLNEIIKADEVWGLSTDDLIDKFRDLGATKKQAIVLANEYSKRQIEQAEAEKQAAEDAAIAAKELADDKAKAEKKATEIAKGEAIQQNADREQARSDDYNSFLNWLDDVDSAQEKANDKKLTQQQQIDKMLLDVIKDDYADELKEEEEHLKEINKMRDDAAKKERERNELSVKDAEQLRDTKIAITNELFNFTQTLSDRKIANLQQEVDAEGNITAQAAAEIAKIKKKQAAVDKAQAIFNIGIYTASAIAEALPNIPLSIAIGVLGGIQAATVLATPLPQFKDGVRGFGGGLAIVGDGGESELVRNPDGTMFMTPDTPTAMYLQKGSDVLNQKQINNEYGSDNSILAKKLDETNELLRKQNSKKSTDPMTAKQHLGNLKKLSFSDKVNAQLKGK